MLTHEQDMASRSPHRFTCIEAGPGCGKTKTVEARVAWLIKQGVDRSRIAVLTFTRQAARELAERLDTSLQHCGTFHSVMLSWLEDSTLQRFHVTPDLPFKVSAKERDRIRFALGGTGDKAGEISSVRSMMAATGVMDYLEILVRANELTRAYCPVDHVVVDESQDLDELQWSILDNLAPQVDSIYLAGDSRQAIYGWRGGSDRFAKSTMHYRLNESFRNPSDVTEIATEIASLAGANSSLGSVTERNGFSIQDDAVGAVNKLIDDFFAPSQIAVLCRYKKTTRMIAAMLDEAGIPVQFEEEKQSSPMSSLIQYIHAPHSPAAFSDLKKHWETAGNERVSKLLDMGQAVAAMVCEQHSAALGHSELGRLMQWVGKLPDDIEDEAFEYSHKYRGYSLHEIARASLGIAEGTAAKGVCVWTMHASKGREWPAVVFVDDFMNLHSEEYRVAFVGLTRAMEQCVYIPGKLKEVVRGIQKRQQGG